MLKEAIEKIIEVSQPIIKEIEGRTFTIDQNGDANEVRPSIDASECITLNSLDSLIKMVKSEALNLYKTPLYITIPTHATLKCFAQPDATRRFVRQTFYEIRINERGINFIEADGGMWKLTARNTIKKFIEDALATKIENGAVIVAL